MFQKKMMFEYFENYDVSIGMRNIQIPYTLDFG